MRNVRFYAVPIGGRFRKFPTGAVWIACDVSVDADGEYNAYREDNPSDVCYLSNYTSVWID